MIKRGYIEKYVAFEKTKGKVKKLMDDGRFVKNFGGLGGLEKQSIAKYRHTNPDSFFDHLIEKYSEPEPIKPTWSWSSN